MSYSIFDKCLTADGCKYYCNQVANRLGLKPFFYYYDKLNNLQFPGNSNVHSFKEFREYESWRIKFNLTNPATIKKAGLDEYVLKHKELAFHLTIKGYSFLLMCKFSQPNHNEAACTIQETVKPIYIEETNGQLRLNL